jgi:hypothetical protein
MSQLIPRRPALVRALTRNGLDRADANVSVQSFEVGNLIRLRSMLNVHLVQLLAPTGAPNDFVAAGVRRTQLTVESSPDDIDVPVFGNDLARRCQPGSAGNRAGGDCITSRVSPGAALGDAWELARTLCLAGGLDRPGRRRPDRSAGNVGAVFTLALRAGWEPVGPGRQRAGGD